MLGRSRWGKKGLNRQGQNTSTGIQRVPETFLEPRLDSFSTFLYLDDPDGLANEAMKAKACAGLNEAEANTHTHGPNFQLQRNTTGQ